MYAGSGPSAWSGGRGRGGRGCRRARPPGGGRVTAGKVSPCSRACRARDLGDAGGSRPCPPACGGRELGDGTGGTGGTGRRPCALACGGRDLGDDAGRGGLGAGAAGDGTGDFGLDLVDVLALAAFLGLLGDPLTGFLWVRLLLFGPAPRFAVDAVRRGERRKGVGLPAGPARGAARDAGGYLVGGLLCAALRCVCADPRARAVRLGSLDPRRRVLAGLGRGRRGRHGSARRLFRGLGRGLGHGSTRGLFRGAGRGLGCGLGRLLGCGRHRRLGRWIGRLGDGSHRGTGRRLGHLDHRGLERLRDRHHRRLEHLLAHRRLARLHAHGWHSRREHRRRHRRILGRGRRRVRRPALGDLVRAAEVPGLTHATLVVKAKASPLVEAVDVQPATRVVVSVRLIPSAPVEHLAQEPLAVAGENARKSEISRRFAFVEGLVVGVQAVVAASAAAVLVAVDTRDASVLLSESVVDGRRVLVVARHPEGHAVGAVVDVVDAARALPFVHGEQVVQLVVDGQAVDGAVRVVELALLFADGSARRRGGRRCRRDRRRDRRLRRRRRGRHGRRGRGRVALKIARA
mmetsp:Transcript_22206/g.73526  ORF Transcript_22206/g.73526 Transcript_22206/m.73526 type:complete len:574 (-) Transcript_22206:559-2280(-)